MTNNIKLKIKNLPIFLLFVICFLLFSNQVYASPRYPIPELNYCASAQECFYFCLIPQNTPACWAYGNSMISTQVLGESDASASAMAKKYGFSFPVSELGNCADIAACKLYCSLPENRAACKSFAQSKGLQRNIQPAQKADMKKILAYAKKELRCSTGSDCQDYCQLPDKRKLCADFAVKYKLQSVPPQEQSATADKLLGYAKNELGCTSTQSCHLFCEDPANRERCARFSRKFIITPDASGSALPQARQLNQPSDAVKPCTADESCRLYCQENPRECPGYSDIATSTAIRSAKTKPIFQSGDFLGPAGCKTEAECRDFCMKYPDKCPGFPPDSTVSTQVKFTPTLKPPLYISPSKTITVTPQDFE